MIATLTGYAVRIPWLGADHTYVLSGDRTVWPCWGRSTGGHPICSGSGDSTVANCLSQTDSHAGILYGITGVCHQTANRILYPSGTIVSAAHGYWASHVLYGTYGTATLSALQEWEARKARCLGLGVALPPSAPPPHGFSRTPDSGPDDPTAAYVQRVRSLYDGWMDKFPLALMRSGDRLLTLLGEELELMVDFRLGKEAQPEDVERLQLLQKDLIGAKQSMVAQLLSKELTARQYANQINDRVNRFLEGARGLIGEARYEQLFALVPGDEMHVIDIRILDSFH